VLVNCIVCNVQLHCFVCTAVYTVCIGERKRSCEVSVEISKAENSEVIDCPGVLNSSRVISSIEVFCCAAAF